jgi:hypothetical protein
MELEGKEMEWKRQEVETCNLQFQLKLAHNFALKNFKLKYNFKIKFMTSTSNFHKSFCFILKMHCSFYFIIWVHNDHFYSWSEFGTFRVQQKNKHVIELWKHC